MPETAPRGFAVVAGLIGGGMSGSSPRSPTISFDVDGDGEADAQAKEWRLIDDPVLGWQNLHPAAKGMLAWQVEFCRREGWPALVVTEFGRTREDMERLHLPGLLQRLEREGLEDDPQAVAQAQAAARQRWSRHCVPLDPTGKPGPFSAYDLRAWIWTPAQRRTLLAETLRAFGGPSRIEALIHAVAGGALHFHFAAKVGEKPERWL